MPTKKGWTATHGGVRSMVTIDDEDSIFYSSARSLGCVALGKTNAPAFGFRATCDNKMYGATKNPYSLDHNSGGSSGGSASAVGAHLVPIAEGGDAGGSIRVPSAWCNCFGYKASAGAIPNVCRPDAWTATHPYCTPGPISRSIRDSKTILSKMIGYDKRDPISAPSLLHRDPSLVHEIQIGFSYDFDFFPDPDDEIKECIDGVVKVLGKAGNSVKPVNFNIAYRRNEVENSWLRSISVDSAVDFELMKKNGVDLLSEHPEDFPQELIYWNEIAMASDMLDYRKFHDIRTNILDAHISAFEDVDFIITPVTGCLPVLNSDAKGKTVGPNSIGGEQVNPLIGFAYTYLENMTGFPAASLPVGFSDSGLPIGIQIIAPRYRDYELINFCSYLASILGLDCK